MLPTIQFGFLTTLFSFSISSCFTTPTHDSSIGDIIQHHRADYQRYKEAAPPTAKKTSVSQNKYSKWCFIRPSCIKKSHKKTNMNSPFDFPWNETSSVVQLMDQLVFPFLDNSSDSPEMQLPECPICMDRKVERFFTPCSFALCSFCDIELAQRQFEGIDSSEEEDKWPCRIRWSNPKCIFKCPVCKVFHYPAKSLEYYRVERGNKNSEKANLVGVPTTMLPSAIFSSFRLTFVELLYGLPVMSKEDAFLKKIGRVRCKIMNLLYEITTVNVAHLDNPAVFASQWYHNMRSQMEKLHYILSYLTSTAEWKELNVWADSLSKMNTEHMVPLGYIIEILAYLGTLLGRSQLERNQLLNSCFTCRRT